MNDVPTILIFEILLLLPVCLLLRFRCVCKEWCELIDSRLFRDTYLSVRRAMDVDDQILTLKRWHIGIPIIPEYKLLNDSVDDDVRLRPGIFENDSYTIVKYSMTYWYDDYESVAQYAAASSASSASAPSSSDIFQIPGSYRDDLSIVGHVNGVICLTNGKCTGFRPIIVNPARLVPGLNWFDIRLVNPALRETRILPDLMFDLGEFCSKINLGGSIHYEIQLAGFGYDDVSDDYKVVLLITLTNEPPRIINSKLVHGVYKHIGVVYRLSTNSWKLCGDMSEFVSRPFIHLSLRFSESVFSHGSIHWIMSTRIVGEEELHLWILVFDVSKELFREMPFPNGWSCYGGLYGRFLSPHIFKVDKSTIALVTCTEDTSYEPDLEIEVWVKKDYNDSDSWTKQYSIYDFGLFREAISFWKKDKLLLRANNLICLDLLKGQLDVDDDPEICIHDLEFVTGHESFVSVKQAL